MVPYLLGLLQGWNESMNVERGAHAWHRAGGQQTLATSSVLCWMPLVHEEPRS